MSVSVRSKIILITIAILFFAVGANTLSSSYVFTKEYSAALKSRTVAIGQGLKLQLDRLLKLEIPIDNLVGFEEQCQNTVLSYQQISHAMVVDIYGKILFHNDISQNGKVLADPKILEAVRRSKESVQVYTKSAVEYYDAIIPVFGGHHEQVGAVIVGFPKNIIAQKTKNLIAYSLGVTLIFFSLAIFLLIFTLSVWVTNPLMKLVSFIQEIRKKKDFSKKVEINSKDEIGELGFAFNQMITDLKESHEEISRYTEGLELKVKERTAELQEINEVLEKDIVKRKRAEQEVKNKAEHLSALYELSKKITSITSREELLPWIAVQAAKLLDADVCYYRIKEGDYLVRGGTTSKSMDMMVRNKIEIGDGLLGLIAKNKKPIILPDAYSDDPRHSCQHGIRAKKHGFRSYLGVPMMIKDEVMGVINVLSKEPEKFKERDIELLTSFADMAAIAIHNAVLFEDLEQEIVEHKKAEEKLRFFEFSVENAGDAVQFADDNARLVYVNEETCTLLGYTREELLTMSLRDIDPLIQTDRLPERWEELKSKGFIKHETVNQAKNGRLIPVDVTAKYLEFEGKGYCCAFVRDITARKEAERQLLLTQFSLDNAADAVFWATQDASIINVNEAACRSLGYTKEELLTKRITDINPDFDRKKWEKHWANKKDKPVATFETQHRKKDGTVFPVEVTASYFVSEGKGYSFSFVRDITERKKAEKKIKTSLEEKKLLLQEIHHRVKNNMQVISSILLLQSASLKDKEVIEIFRQSRDRIKSMALIHDKLYQTEDLANIDFKEYIQDLTQYLFDSYKRNENNVDFNINVNNIFLDIDTAVPLGLIINELVTNALRHAFKDGRKGELSVSIREVGQEQLELIVSDNGEGLPESIDLKNPENLGLQIVVLLVEKQLYGNIDLRRNGGTEFQITIKRKRCK